MVVCPFCRLEVTPARNDAGQLVCPACANTGNPDPARGDSWAAESGPAAPGNPAPAPPAGPPSRSHDAELARSPDTPRVSGLAIAALILGIAAMLTLSGLGLVGAAAIVLGVMGLRQVGRSGGALRGRGLAATGAALGAASIALALVSLAAFLAFVAGQQELQGVDGTRGGPTGSAPTSAAPTWEPASPSAPCFQDHVPSTSRLATWQPKDAPGSGDYLAVEVDQGSRFPEGARVYRQQDHPFDDGATGNGLLVRAFMPDNQGYVWTIHLVARCAPLENGTFVPITTADADAERPRLEMIVDNVQCHEARGAFVVDDVVRGRQGAIEAITLRLEFHCQREEPALMAKLHWSFV